MKIVVRGTNWIGDAVMTVPAVRRLRRWFPEAHIALHTRPAAAAVFEDADFLDEILLIDEPRSAFGDAFAQSRLLKKGQFDIGIVLTNAFEGAAAQRLAGIPSRFGYATEGRRLILTAAIPVPSWKSERHEVYYYLNLIDTVGSLCSVIEQPTEREPPELVLTVSAVRRERAAAFLAENGIDTGRRTIALGVGSTNSRAKRWPAESYAVLADRLASELDAQLIIVGSAGDRIVADEVMKLASAKIVDLCGRTTVSEAAAILASVGLVISNDMGLAHIAPAVGTPTLVIFGPTNENTTRPFSTGAEVIRKQVDCSPCMLRDCPIDHRCMTGVAVDAVFERARYKIDSK